MRQIILLLTLLVPLALAQDVDPAALQGLLDKWKAAWNDADVAKTIPLYAPEAKMTKRLEKEGAKEKYVASTKNIKDQLGDITEIKLGKYSESGRSYIMKVKYSKQEQVIAGSFSIIKDKDGGILFKSFNFEGMGEPELKE